MKISWGYKIAGLYIGFVLMIVSMVFMSAASKNELERADYYEEELKHDVKMAAISNMNELNDSIFIEKITDQISILYPEFFNQNNADVAVWVYNPANEKEDKKIHFTCNNRPQIILTKNWIGGTYILRFNITVSSKKYFFEQEITLK